MHSYFLEFLLSCKKVRPLKATLLNMVLFTSFLCQSGLGAATTTYSWHNSSGGSAGVALYRDIDHLQIFTPQFVGPGTWATNSGAVGNDGPYNYKVYWRNGALPNYTTYDGVVDIGVQVLGGNYYSEWTGAVATGGTNSPPAVGPCGTNVNWYNFNQCFTNTTFFPRRVIIVYQTVGSGCQTPEQTDNMMLPSEGFCVSLTNCCPTEAFLTEEIYDGEGHLLISTNSGPYWANTNSAGAGPGGPGSPISITGPVGKPKDPSTGNPGAGYGSNTNLTGGQFNTGLTNLGSIMGGGFQYLGSGLGNININLTNLTGLETVDTNLLGAIARNTQATTNELGGIGGQLTAGTNFLVQGTNLLSQVTNLLSALTNVVEGTNLTNFASAWDTGMGTNHSSGVVSGSNALWTAAWTFMPSAVGSNAPLVMVPLSALGFVGLSDVAISFSSSAMAGIAPTARAVCLIMMTALFGYWIIRIFGKAGNA